MEKGSWVVTRRSGHGYLFDKYDTGAKRVRVILIDANFKQTGKSIMCRKETLRYVGLIER